jgi:hypothetical protein
MRDVRFSMTENATKCGSRAQNLKYGVNLGAGVGMVLPATGRYMFTALCNSYFNLFSSEL